MFDGVIVLIDNPLANKGAMFKGPRSLLYLRAWVLVPDTSSHAVFANPSEVREPVSSAVDRLPIAICSFAIVDSDFDADC